MKKWFAVAGIIAGIIALLTIPSLGVAPIVFAGLGIVAEGIAHLVP